MKTFFKTYFQSNQLQNATQQLRFGMELCINYAEIISFVHNTPNGTYVICDERVSRAVEKMMMVEAGQKEGGVAEQGMWMGKTMVGVGVIV